MKTLSAGALSYFDMPFAAERISLNAYVLWLLRQHRMTPAVAEAVERARKTQKEFRIIAYCAGALTEATAEDKLRYETASGVARRHMIFLYVPHLFGTDPQKHPNVTPGEVRDIDYLWAAVMPDFHVNFLSPIAHGNAIEEGWGEGVFVPTVYCVPAGIRLSRLTKGMANIDMTISYQDVAEAYRELDNLFALLAKYAKSGFVMVSRPDLRIFFVQRKYERGEIVDPVLRTISDLGKACSPTAAVIVRRLEYRGIFLDTSELVAVFNCLIWNDKIYLAGFTQEDGYLRPYFLPREENAIPYEGVELYPWEMFKRARPAWAYQNASDEYYTAHAIRDRLMGIGASTDDKRFAAILQDVLRNGGMGIGFTLEGNTLAPCFYFEC